MYLKRIQFNNYGPVEHLDITPKFGQNGKPKPIVLIGKNGSGKTLLLSSILDSLIELKRKKYSEIAEVDPTKYLKVGKKDYIKEGCEFSHIKLQYEDSGRTASYTDLMTSLTHPNFITKYGSRNFEGANDNKFRKNGFYKNCNVSNQDILDCFGNNIISFFPHSRYDHPAWLNKDTKIGFTFEEKFINQTSKSIIKHDVIKEIETWILDCLLDREIYEKQLLRLPNQPLEIFAGY